MKNVSAKYLLDVKDRARIAKIVIDATIITLFILGGVYFVYWMAVMTDPMMYELGKELFNPLAKLLTPYDSTMYIFRTTSLKLFGLIIPTLCLYYMVDKYEERAHKKYDDLLKQQHRQMMLRARLREKHQYDSIKEFSICLSIDYSDNAKKEALNGMVFADVKQYMAKRVPYVSVNIISANSMIMRSKEFSKYDYAYDVLLKVLATAKKNVEKTYEIKMMPSITTDAFTVGKDNRDIEENHFNIQTFNFKNKALCTAEFSKKYQHLKHNKYAGIPIGEYAFFNKESENTYELNIVNKDLISTLASM